MKNWISSKGRWGKANQEKGGSPYGGGGGKKERAEDSRTYSQTIEMAKLKIGD